MTSASATTEQKINGQIGHPAACMIESKVFPRGDRRLCERIIADAQQRLSSRLSRVFLTAALPLPLPLLRLRKVSTVSVDNSVGNPA